MQLTAFFAAVEKAEYTANCKEITGAITETENMDEARHDLLDPFKLVFECDRKLARELALAS